ncbi:MAG: 50S ribosomal protein L6 [Candidatus Zambryskibacteria bacterium]|nr:50S ribosomal protein L6 [Candidatus Zambryskibacteria bacterium]
MSRIGKKIILIPKNTEVTLTSGVFTVKGPQGTLSKKLNPDILVTITPESITLLPKRETIALRSLWGTYGSHITNMVSGVNTFFVKKLILEGIGYKSEVKGDKLVLALGFSHPVIIDIPASLKVTAEKNVITMSGINKEEVGAFAAMVRDWKKPEPYKGKGLRYEGEVVKRKQGKKSA